MCLYMSLVQYSCTLASNLDNSGFLVSMADLGALWAMASLGVMVWVRECTLLCVCICVGGECTCMCGISVCGISVCGISVCVVR